MSKRVNPEWLKIDRRIIARKLLIGELSEKDLAGLLKKLPDVSDNAEEIQIQPGEKPSC
ncbi:MAG TPA: hypothetical protein P5208_00495 [Smithellaceae bacterium]|nr:hypothetical protein [Smithellaceae bacterium]HRV43749.1 hypothetical protein [Smithellaceae bacterium]